MQLCRRRTLVAAGLLVSLLVLVAGCGGSDKPKAAEAGVAPDNYPTGSFTFYVATPPSGGGAIAAETISAALKTAKIVDGNIQTLFRPGGSGTVGFTVFALEAKAANDKIMLALPSLISNPAIQGTDVTYKDFTPIARLFSEYELMTVKADSKIKDLKSLAAALKKDPKEVRFFGGSVGSADHILAAKFAIAAGVPVKDLIYVGEAGGDTQVAQLLGGHTDVLIGGTDNLDLVDAGEARALAVSSAERLPGNAADVPTFVEQGFDVVELNWRSVVGPPQMPAYAREYFVDVFKQLTESPEWAAAAEKNFWAPTVLLGDEFTAFLEEESTKRTDLLRQLGLID
jgi:putative tricarboxylic transport membrane protein